MELHKSFEKSMEGVDDGIVWKVIKNMEYDDGILSRVISLYIVDFVKDSKSKSVENILIRIGVSCNGSPFGDNVEIEFMHDVFPYKFKSRRKSSLLKIKEFLAFLEMETGFKFLEKMQPALVSEYKKDLKSIRTDFYS